MFKIRKFKEDDSLAITKLISTVLREMFKCRQDQINDKLGSDLFLDLKNIKNNYIDVGGVFYVGECDDKIVGTVALTPKNKDTVVFRRFYLYKQYRGRGFGFKMYLKAQKWAIDNGYKNMILFTFPHFTVALKMYKRLGFKNFRKTKDGMITCTKSLVDKIS